MVNESYNRDIITTLFLEVPILHDLFQNNAQLLVVLFLYNKLMLVFIDNLV